tara:strand:- start:321 stop:1103 length:783 start_codon:yes stop_codon:yes gene_type:complete
MAYIPPSQRKMFQTRNNDAFKSFNKGKNRRNNREYIRNDNFTDFVDVMPNFPKDRIKDFTKKYNITIKLKDSKLTLYGKKEDISNFVKYIDEYIKRNYNHNENSYPELIKVNKSENIKWGDKNGKEIGEDLEKTKYKDLAKKKEEERQKILDKNTQNNIYNNRDINMLISNLPKLKEEYNRNNEEYYDYNKDHLYTKSFISEQDRLDCELTDEDQYNLMAIKYSEKYSEYWLDENGEEILDEEIFDEVVTKKEKMELANL